MHQFLHILFADVKFFTAFCVHAVQYKMGMDMIAVAVCGYHDLISVELFCFLRKA